MPEEKATPRRPRVALVTCAAQPHLFEEEGDFVPMLIARGVDAEAVAWDQPGVVWADFDLAVIRSTWDYFLRFAEFAAWLDHASNVTRVCNPPSLVRCKLDKFYLRELSARGVRIVPTVFCAARAPADLEGILTREGWASAVMKPAVSGGAFRTYRVTPADAPAHQAEMNSLLTSVGVLIQPFFPEILTEGELSLFFFDGVFCHGVIKRPKEADYRVQTQHGGTFVPLEPEPSLLAQVAKVLAALPEPAVYARIDGVVRNGDFYLMEAELIEPYLFLAGRPDAAERYVATIERHAREAARRSS